jgi:hypothetical protein
MLAHLIVMGMIGAACNSAGVVPPTTTQAQAATPLTRPIDYVLPSGCDFVGSSELRNLTTYWQVKCSASGSLQSVLTPSLASQGWEQCGVASNRAYFRTTSWLITVSVVASSDPSELSEMARSSGCGNLPGG